VWKGRFQFKDSIYLNEHYPREIESNRRELYPVLKLIKKMDKYKKVSTLAGDRLIINGESFTTETLDKLPDDIDISVLYTKTENNVTYFFRKRSPLSNHHPAPFRLDDVDYTSSEQYYFAEMERRCSDEGALATVMGSDDPTVQMNAGRGIRVKTKAWESHRLKAMKDGVRQKVLQNEYIRQFLKDTGDSTIAECSPNDDYFGIGLGMNDEKRKNNNKWGHNHMGVLLESIRSELD
jgi:hypothetical protein